MPEPLSLAMPQPELTHSVTFPADVIDTLNGYCREIHAEATNVVKGIYEQGRILKAARSLIAEVTGMREGYGYWHAWVRDHVQYSPRTAKRLINVATMLEQEGIADMLGNQRAEKTALHKLAKANGAVREEAVAVMQSGRFLTAAIVRGLIQQHTLRDAVENLPERVRVLCLDHNVAVDSVPLISQVYTQLPAVFEEMELSGAIDDADGYALAIEDANYEQMERYLNRCWQERTGQALVEKGNHDAPFEQDDDDWRDNDSLTAADLADIKQTVLDSQAGVVVFDDPRTYIEWADTTILRLIEELEECRM